MKSKEYNTLLLTTLVFLLSFSFTNAQTKDKYCDNLIIIKVHPEYKNSFKSNQNFISLFSKTGVSEISQKFPHSPIPERKYNEKGEKLVDLSLIYQVRFRNEIDVLSFVSYLNKLEFIDYAEPNYHMQLLYLPDDPMNIEHQYWLNNIMAYQAWDIHQGDTNVVIGIVDTGIDISHEDLIYNIKYNYNDLPNGNDDDNDGYIDNFRGWDFGDNDNNPQANPNVESGFHGSWVSGISSPETDNGKGLSGVGFKTKFLPIKVMNSDGIINTAYDGVVYAADQGCKVINCSWGNTTYQQLAQDVVNYATYNRDALVVGAAGNKNNDDFFFPASYENVLSVAGTTVDDEKWGNFDTSSGSSFGFLVDVSAPGTMMRTTGNGDYMMAYAGTSFAAPVVSGLAGILRSFYPEMSALQIGELIKISSDLIDTIPHNQPYAGMLGTGRVNMYNALVIEYSPAIQLKSPEISDNREPGDIVYISGNLVNFLAQSENLSVNVIAESPYLEVVNADFIIGELNTMESINLTDQIAVVVHENTPFDYESFIRLEFMDGDYTGVQSIPLTVNYGYKNIETEKLKMSVTAYGRFGYSDLSGRNGEGLWYNQFFKLFYDSGIMYGLSSSRIMSSVRQDTDFNTILFPEFVESDNEDYQLIQTKFDDSSDPQALGLEIVQKVYAFDVHENFVIVNYDIINKNSETVEDIYFGIFTDWDLVDASNNSVYYNPEQDLMYCRSNSDQNLFAGIKLLSNQTQNVYALSQTTGGDGVVDITDGFSDIERFHLISNSNSGTGSVENGTDAVITCSAGPFSIVAGDTAKLSFAFIAAGSQFVLLQSANEALELFDDRFGESSVFTDIENDIIFYPNPVGDVLVIDRNKEFLNSEIRLTIKDIKGNIEIINRLPAGEIKSYISLDGVSKGMYFITLETPNSTITGKLLIID
jgi:serine protease